MKLIFFLTATLFLFPQIISGQLKTIPFEKIDSLQQTEKRVIIVLIHTDWCKYCQTMKNTTLKNNQIINVLNNKFYFLDLNAETNQKINFNKQTFDYKPTGNKIGINELAEHLATINGKIAYPTLCVLNSDYEIIFQHNQLINTEGFNAILNSLNASILKVSK